MFILLTLLKICNLKYKKQFKAEKFSASPVKTVKTLEETTD
jgi:hypothetical protein